MKHWLPFLCLWLFVSCKYDHAGIADDAPVTDLETVSASVTGIVVNENNIPLSGVTVSSGGSNTTTNMYGIFRFKNITLSKNNATIKVVQNGYYTAYRTFPAISGRTHNVRIKLIPKTNNGSFASVSGGTVNISGGGKLVIPAGAVTDASGNAYSGTVNVAATWINPTAPDLNSIIPGDLRGITTGGQERAIETYGMLGVELTGAGGQALKIATGKTAALTFPIPAALQASAPATIPLWYFDEATARWKEEGAATKNGNHYEGNVSHFSFWNCDAPWPQITLCMTLQTPNGQPLSNVPVRIRRVNVPTSTAVGYTDSLGNLCGIVPKNEPLVMEVLAPCGNVVYSQNIGPFSANTSLGNITVTIPAANQVTVTGTVVNCNNQPVTNGYVFIYYSGGNYTTVPVNNGVFNAVLLNCAGSQVQFLVTPVDNNAQQQGLAVAGNITTGTANIGLLQACSLSSAQYIDMLIDGVPYSFSMTDSIRLQTVPNLQIGLPQFSTTISALQFDPNTGAITLFLVAFSHNALVPLPYALGALNIMIPGTTANMVLTPNPQLNLTEFGAPQTGYIAGNCSVQMQFDTNPAQRTVQCQFRLRRI
ncbi:MAG: hypothetical protein JNM68_00130 [Dinghuibacter sp.]|nr:hypothetical protein [Dinghuibacter sp.]